MKTVITLDKKQGLFRPRVTIAVELDPWERDLVPAHTDLSFTASVWVPHSEKEAVLYSDGHDCESYSRSPYVKYYKKDGKWAWEAFLPWKPGELTIEDYPDVEKLARHIQDRVAKILTHAIESVEVNETRELPPPEGYKEKAAAYKFAALAKQE